jgi:DNA-binding transcriptional LysR family regulator
LTFKVKGEELTVPLNAEVSSNSPIFNKSMLVEGFGLGVVPKAIIEEELMRGDLVPILEEFPLVDSAIEIRLAYNSRTLLPAKVRVFQVYATEFYGALAHDERRS